MDTTKKEPVDFDKLFKEMYDFTSKLINKSRYNAVLLAFCTERATNKVVNALLSDKKLFLPSETKTKLYKLMDEGVPNMIRWYYALKEIEESANKITAH